MSDKKFFLIRRDELEADYLTLYDSEVERRKKNIESERTASPEKQSIPKAPVNRETPQKQKFGFLAGVTIGIGAVALLGIVVSILLLSDWGQSPDEETIRSGLQDYVESTSIALMGQVMPNIAKYGGPKNKLVEYRITNEYTKEKDGEKFYIYDFETDISHYSGEKTITGTIGFVKRGNSWYSIRLD